MTDLLYFVAFLSIPAAFFAFGVLLGWAIDKASGR